jgi:hypothetical protein
MARLTEFHRQQGYEMRFLGCGTHRLQRAQTTKTKLEKPQRAPPAHMQAPPEPMHLPLDECMPTT